MNAKLPAGAAPMLRFVVDEARRRKTALYVVGGWVRDRMLGSSTDDLDLVAESDPIPVARACARRFGGKLEVFERFGTARLLLDGGVRLDFAQTREERYSGPSALPEVELIGSIQRDLKRRDFTVNAMAAPLTMEGFDLNGLVDPFRGAEDLRRKALRTLHGRSFRDDPTRIFRAARYACRLGFRLDASAEAQRREASAWLRLLTRERLRAELVSVLEERKPGCALKKLKSWKLLDLIHAKASWPRDLQEGSGAWERLGMMALHMGGPEGRELIESLHLERPVSRALLEGLRLAGEKASARSPLDTLTKAVLRRSLRRLSESALAPLFVNGGDLAALGLKPGPDYKLWLERAAKAQWAGRFSARAQALRWLKAAIGGGA